MGNGWVKELRYRRRYAGARRQHEQQEAGIKVEDDAWGRYDPAAANAPSERMSWVSTIFPGSSILQTGA